MDPIPRRNVLSSHPLLSYGFRPFFLVGAAYAGLGVLIWIPLFFGEIVVPTAFSPLDWHIHEMLYGYLPAIVAGFLLTAIPNWTGRLPLQGRALAVLVTVWMAGRVAVCVSALIGRPAAGAVDVLFLVLTAAAAGREVIAGRNWRNLPPVFILLAFAVGDVIFHLEDYRKGSAELGTRLGIAAAVLLISLIGGRIIPSFTRNWLTRENPGRLPLSFGRLDIGVLVISLFALALWIATSNWTGTAALMLLAGFMQAIRLARWAGDRTLRDQLVLVLHVGYAFVPLGFVMLGGAILVPSTVPVSAGIHCWTVGAIGTMTLAVMTRVSLGHTDQKLTAGPLTRIIYGTVVFAACLRIAAAFPSMAGRALLEAAATAWIAAFWLFVTGYGALLFRPRRNAR
jgi:uncharacterized protein involved in response to NO